MKNWDKLILLIIILSLLFGNCSKEKTSDNRVIIGISSDIESLNPLFSFSVNEGNISELLFLSLVKHKWNSKTGELESTPMLAKNWQWAKDSSYLIVEIRDDVKWSDGVNTSLDDVIFSFDVYSEPLVQSRLFGSFKNFYCDENNHIDLKRTFQVLSPTRLKINFIPNSVPALFDIDFPVIPKHAFEKIKRNEIQTSEENFKPVSNGPFVLSKWERNQSIILKVNKSSFLYNPGNINELIFKIVPDYVSRINQLKNGEIDLVEDIKTEDILDLQKNENLKIVPVKGREYDYLGWNNIDGDIYCRSKRILPNKYFGDVRVRNALTIAVNRKEILDEFLDNNGELAFSPVSPIFIKAFNSDIKPYDYDTKIAGNLLYQAGWADNNNDGILEKENMKFYFKLYIPAGNPRREFAAKIVKNNLRQIGIETDIESVELGVFIDNLFKRNYDAWMAGWTIPIPIELKSYWFSDLEKTSLNLVGYRNKEIDNLIVLIENEKSVDQKNLLYKRFQEIVHKDQPITFLYWIDNPVAFNKRIENININPLGAVRECWTWTIKE
jgi:peptide/nickel transport system substrate-binding protein